MKNLIKRLGLLIILLAPSIAFAGTIREYSADVVDVKSGRIVSTYYVTEKKMRVDSFDSEGGKHGEGPRSIIRMDHGKMYSLREDKTYLEFPMKGDTVPNMEEMGSMMMGGAAPKRMLKKLGTETVSGYKAEKFQVTTTIDMFGQTHTMSHYEWKAKEFDLPVRMQNEDGEIMEMRNIKTGAPDASVFEIPAGYKKNTQMEDRMKQMPSTEELEKMKRDMEEMIQGQQQGGK